MPNLEAPDRQSNGLNPAVVADRSQRRLCDDSSLVGVAPPARTQDQATPAVRLLLAADRIRIGLSRLIEEEADYGRGILLVPVYIGIGAIFWFTAGADPPPQAVFAALIIFAVGFFLKRDAGPRLRHLLLAGMLVCFGMALAQLEAWRASTVMLDTAVTTTIAGRVERRESSDKERWRYVVALDATENPTIRRPPERVTVFVRKQQQPFELGDLIQTRARLTPPAGPALPGLNDFAFSAYFNGIGANGFAYGTPT
ncbi:DUF4131 domain-containing protein [Rhizobium rhizogenes]|uniref:DUF4131 domain-containing protein n=1 Tax=Rhizobium rhizogenes TaxID=359 RepID=UPI000AF28A9B|nr:DUF4131 domain-containing protein [Rhizobium rhizogenes]WEO66378.1 DUF4131 domain-containing protein [Rhizobium rhizogenes]